MSAGSPELDAFGRLVELNYRAVVAVAFATTRDLALSEDVAQDTFIAAWAARGTRRDAARVRAWLCGIARNQGRNALRRYRRETAFEHVRDDAPSALDQTIGRQIAHEVRAALARLPRVYREPLVLFYWQDQDIAQVASALALSEPAAQKRISRGRAYLKEGLTDKLEQLGARRRSAGTVAAAVLGIVATRTVARAAAASSIATRIFPVAAKSLAVVALGAAAVVVGTTASRTRGSCAQPAAPTPSPDLTQHLTSLERELAVITYNDLDHSAGERQLEKRVAALEHVAHVAPRPREAPTHAAKKQPRPAVSSTPEPQTCDLVACQFDGWKGSTCCAELQRHHDARD